jgi:hypothetical protein
MGSVNIDICSLNIDICSLNIDIVNTICKFVDDEDFQSIRIALQPQFSEEIEFHCETIVTNEFDSYEELEQQLLTGKPKLYSDIDKLTDYERHKITMILKTFPHEDISEEFNIKYYKMINKLYNKDIFIDYIKQIDKLLLQLYKINYNSILLQSIFGVKEVYLSSYHSSIISLLEINFSVLCKLAQNKSTYDLKLKKLTLEGIRVCNMCTNKDIHTLKSLTFKSCTIFTSQFNNLDEIIVINSLFRDNNISMMNLREVYLDCDLDIISDKFVINILNVTKLTFKFIDLRNTPKNRIIHFTNTSSLNELVIDSANVLFDDLSNVKKLSLSLYKQSTINRENTICFNYETILEKCFNVEELTFIKSKSNTTAYKVKLDNSNLLYINSYVDLHITLSENTNNLLSIIRFNDISSDKEQIFCSVPNINVFSKLKFMYNTTMSENIHKNILPYNLKIFVHWKIYTFISIRCISYYKNIFYEYVFIEGLTIREKYNKFIELFPEIKKFESMNYDVDRILMLNLSDKERGFFEKNKEHFDIQIRSFISVKAQIIRILNSHYGIFIPINVDCLDTLMLKFAKIANHLGLHHDRWN